MGKGDRNKRRKREKVASVTPRGLPEPPGLIKMTVTMHLILEMFAQCTVSTRIETIEQYCIWRTAKLLSGMGFTTPEQVEVHVASMPGEWEKVAAALPKLVAEHLLETPLGPITQRGLDWLDQANEQFRAMIENA